MKTLDVNGVAPELAARPTIEPIAKPIANAPSVAEQEAVDAAATTPTRTRWSLEPRRRVHQSRRDAQTTAATAASSPEIATAAMITVSAFTPRSRAVRSPSTRPHLQADRRAVQEQHEPAERDEAAPIARKVTQRMWSDPLSPPG